MDADVTINVTNDFCASPFPPYRLVRHVDTSGKPQFTAVEERVIGLNESRRVYQDFIAHGLNDVPLHFRKLAKKIIFMYQRAITQKTSKRAILCDQQDSAGKIPPEAKPQIVRQEYGQYTYNWFLAEYRTLPLSRESDRIRRRRKLRDQTEDPGYISSHSIDLDSL